MCIAGPVDMNAKKQDLKQHNQIPGQTKSTNKNG